MKRPGSHESESDLVLTAGLRELAGPQQKSADNIQEPALMAQEVWGLLTACIAVMLLLDVEQMDGSSELDPCDREKPRLDAVPRGPVY